MSLWKIAWRNIEQRALSSSLTAFSMALGVATVVAVLVSEGVIRDSFTRGAGGYHLVVGKKGSQLQLVLNTVYHLQDPIQNLPYSYYKEFLSDGQHTGQFAPWVKVAIPYCLGDNYEGYRVVGTTPDLFDKLEYAADSKYEFQSGGRNFKPDNFFEAVIGSTVASKTGLKVGDEFQPVHGITNEGDGHKHDAFKIVGVLKPTGTANDRALFVNIEGFYLLDKHALTSDPTDLSHQAPPAHSDEHNEKHAEAEHKDAPHDDHDHKEADHKDDVPKDADHKEHDHIDDHDKLKHDDDHAHDEKPPHDHDAKDQPHDEKHADEHAHKDHDHDEHAAAHAGHDDHDHDGHHHDHKPLPEDQREVTAVLLLARDDMSAQGLRTAINKGVVAQAAAPIRVIEEFFKSMVQGASIALLVLTGLIVLVAGIGLMVSIYNSMNDRRRDIAVMRALGAGRSTVLSIILLESVLLSLCGGLLGFLLGHLLVGAIGPIVEAFAGVSLGFLQFVPYEFILIPLLVVLASVMGYLPAMTAYRTDVAKALSQSP